MIRVNEFISSYEVLLSNEKLYCFYGTPYGLELMLKLYQQKQSKSYMHIDELFLSLKSVVPRREAFGKYINRLEGLGCIQKSLHSKKKSMKSILLSKDIILELDLIFNQDI